MSNPHAALAQLGLTLPTAPKPVAAYVPAVRSGNLIFVSGQLPMSNGVLLQTGPVPSKVSVEDAQAAAKQCALNALAVIADQLGGDLGKVTRPTLIVQCARDAIAPREVGAFMHNALGESTYRELDASGHCPHMSHPTETIDVIRGYLGQG